MGDHEILLSGASNSGLADPGQNAALFLCQVTTVLRLLASHIRHHDDDESREPATEGSRRTRLAAHIANCQGRTRRAIRAAIPHDDDHCQDRLNGADSDARRMASRVDASPGNRWSSGEQSATLVGTEDCRRFRIVRQVRSFVLRVLDSRATIPATEPPSRCPAGGSRIEVRPRRTCPGPPSRRCPRLRNEKERQRCSRAPSSHVASAFPLRRLGILLPPSGPQVGSPALGVSVPTRDLYTRSLPHRCFTGSITKMSRSPNSQAS